MRELELLAPAGSFDSVKAAITAGADAVYMGGSRFGARAFATSVTEDSLAKAIDYVHLHGKKLFLTVNTLLTQKELEQELVPWLTPYYEQGLDGVIVQDFGVVSVLKQNFPDLPLHASTQMMITGAHSAKLLKEAGIVRVVAARELSLSELATIYKETGMELEAFVHGSVCYCYSGQCLLSSLTGGRSGNRGACAQPCRLPYLASDGKQNLNTKKDAYLMSLKDMCTLEYLPQMIEAGVMSFKIEGRMKSPLYTAGVVSVYRKYLDLYQNNPKGYKVDKKDLQILTELFDRGGFSSHYLVGNNAKTMIATKEKKEFRAADTKLRKELELQYIEREKKENLIGNVIISTGKFAKLSVQWHDFFVEVFSEQVVEESQKAPLSKEDVKKQLNKTGDSPYQWEELNITITGNTFLPVKQLNLLRRKALEALTQKVLDSYKRVSLASTISYKKFNLSKEMGFSVSLDTLEGLDVVLSYKEVNTVIINSEEVELNQLCSLVNKIHSEKKRCLLALPVIFRGRAYEEFNANWQEIIDSKVDGLVVENLDEAGWLSKKKWPLPVLFDHRMYVWNRKAKEFISNFVEPSKFLGFTAPLELSEQELYDMGCEQTEMVVYGRAPMMVSANCIRLTTGQCVRKQNKNHYVNLTDRKNQTFPVKNVCKYCYNVMYNSVPLSLSDRTKKVLNLEPMSLRLSFTTEKEEEIRNVLDVVIFAFKKREAGKVEGSFTRGHFTGISR
jgi:putative protease